MTEIISNKYFPEITLNNNYGDSEKYGILNITLIKSKNVVTGYIWKYTYYTKDKKLKVISSYDLIKLRKMVEKQNQKWIIFDLEKARKSYEINKQLQKKHSQLKKETYNTNKKSASGVRYVYKNKNYWCYRRKNKSYSHQKLSELKKKINKLNLDWIITDHQVYNSIIQKE